MLVNLTDSVKKMLKSKLFPMVVVYVILFGILIGRMFFLQIMHGEEYDKIAAFQSQKTREVKSARGKIFDCNGKLLASNEKSYTITYEDTGELETSESKNEMILRLVNIIEKTGDSIDLEFPISLNKSGKLEFNVDENAELRFKKDIYSKKYISELTDQQKYATAQEIFEYLRRKDGTTKFDIGSKYTDIQALKIMNVRYAMMMNNYKKYIPISISTNVSEKTVAAIKENVADLPGIDVSEDLNRVYYDSKYFAHIIGYTGLISSDTLVQLQDENPKTPYSASDQIGKTGIEKKFEDVLRGKKGSEQLILNSASRITKVANRVEATVGNDVYLTIDSELQKSCYKILEKKIAGILISKLNNSKDAGSKGVSATNIRVPIYDVYNAIFKNNLVDITQFEDSDATGLEKSVYSKYQSAYRSANSRLKSQLAASNRNSGKDQVSETMQGYLDHVFSLLKTKKIIMIDNIDKTDKTYIRFINKKASLSEFLQYAIAKNWVNLELLNIGDEYYSTEEIYDKLIKNIFNQLSEDIEYDKLVYHEMVYDGTVSGREVCLLLYDQGVLKKNDKAVDALKSGGLSPFEFMIEKIRSLDITPGQLGLEPCSGSIVVTDVNTGKIKALVSYPSYDNNKFANSVDNEYFNKINTSAAAPLINRTTQQKTAPGSTFKMLTAIAALQEGVITPYSTVKDDVTFKKIGLPYPKCWKSSGHGTINVTQAIKDSCNYFFYEMGFLLGDGHGNSVNNEKGLAQLKKYATMFGLNDTSGVELSEFAPHISDYDCVRSAIGQSNNSFTPIQLSRYVTAVGNRGTCYNLSVLDRTEDATTKEVKQNSAKVKNTINILSTTWEAVYEGMKKVVNDGSINKLFKDSPVQVAGKTGTAQESKSKPDHALFVSFAPYSKPEISVTTVIANGYTSSNAAELASDVYTYYFDKKSRNKLMKQKVSAPKMGTKYFSD